MLTIIVPVRNESDYIISLYDYFLNNLKNINYEVLIINDFSNDNTFEQCLMLEKKDNRIKALNNKKKGLGGAINLGIRKASGNFLKIMMLF